MSDPLLQGLFKIPSPIEKNAFLSEKTGTQFWIKRDDLIHPIVSGNKWRKLAPYFTSYDHEGIITAGGYHSNHLHATAFACRHRNIPCVGLVRGVKPATLDKTLVQCQEWGMALHFVDRQAFDALQYDPVSFDKKYRNWMSVPIGGASKIAAVGSKDIIEELPFEPDVICSPVGTGTTLAGLVIGSSKSKVFGVSPFNPAPDELIETVADLAGSSSFEIIRHPTNAPFGRMTKQYYEQLVRLMANAQIPLDPVYNGKALLGLLDWLSSGSSQSIKSVVYVNTGGFQGWAGMEQRYGFGAPRY